MEQKRETNLDLLRILSMLMILTLHILSKGGLLNTENTTDIQYYIYWLLECLSIVAVNCYILISGYFLIKSQFKLKKFLTLWAEVLFYSVLMYIITIIFENKTFAIKDCLKSFLPVLTKQYWFVNCYLVMYLLSPFINKFINSLDKQEFKKILIILIIIFSVMTVLPSDMSLDSTEGYGIIWFICLYLTGAYIRLYFREKEVKNKKYLFIYIFTAIILYIGINLLKYISLNKGLNDYSLKLLCYNNIIVLIESLALFLFFRNIEIKKATLQKGISLIASLTFAVYLIHEQPFFRNFFYNKILNIKNLYNNNYSIPITILIILITFIICIFVEYIRKSILVYIEKNIKKIKSKKEDINEKGNIR